MTHDYKLAQLAVYKYNPTYEEEDSDFLSEESCNRFGFLMAPHHSTICSALQLAQEAQQLHEKLADERTENIKQFALIEQLRKERDELAREVSSLKDEIAILNGEYDE